MCALAHWALVLDHILIQTDVSRILNLLPVKHRGCSVGGGEGDGGREYRNIEMHVI